eukprot:CAMPEP_0172605308 /NCGR_PEP_ID=MMETSP1068-20121228/25541_1 /TAXON_ID=35684 /ORGANISM="Pseudopedinella elastica, Strain CCMP716" /LENGTH=104 /DNA_ID=CAMNT_0013407667 /DNA_START=39 /DNA_END=353 /DNA_ORIENTATION=+
MVRQVLSGNAGDIPGMPRKAQCIFRVTIATERSLGDTATGGGKHALQDMSRVEAYLAAMAFQSGACDIPRLPDQQRRIAMRGRGTERDEEEGDREPHEAVMPEF